MWMDALWFMCLTYVSAEIYSCGGFVKSVIPIDYSKIQVKLVTPEGHLKYEEECNPKNGYYMIPVYNKGQYSIKLSAPEGWYFDPDIVHLNLDGVNDPCTMNQDINFFLTGFSIHGVVDDGSGSGPSGLPLTLKLDGKVVDSTTTTEGGKYSFRAGAGNYVVSTEDSSVCISHGQAFVEVTNAPVLVKPDLRISGYELIVQIANNDKPVPNVRVILYSEQQLELGNCKEMTSKTNDMPNAKFICSIGVTSGGGITSVPCLPSGSYFVEAQYKTEETEFLFTPALHKFSMGNQSVKLAFSVIGFTARGRVVVDKIGFPGAHVIVKGQKAAETDSNGYYTLRAITEGDLEVTARAPHTKFSVERSVLVLPNIKIGDVKVEGFDVCGTVERNSHGKVVSTLLLKRSGSFESVLIEPAADGKFCKMVVPGKYSVSPSDLSSTLTPRSLDIDVTTSYVLDLHFTHFKTNVVVVVNCIGTCETLSISLLQGAEIVETVHGKDEFIFKNIGPGAYRVRIDEGDRACWEQREQPLIIDKIRPKPLHFVQSGFTSVIKLSHPAHLKWSHNEKKQLRGDVYAPAGLSAICTPVQGRYNVQVKSCMNFDPSQFDITVASGFVYESKAVEAIISGSINSTDGSGFVIKVKSGVGERDVSVSANGFFFFYELLSHTGDIIIAPYSATHLFDPPTIVFHFKGDCAENALNFVATKGIFIDGSIVPAVSGVKITGQHRRDASIKFVTVSDFKGKYRIGPIRRTDEIKITAELDGYSFSEDPEHIGRILSTKLSKLTVVVSDAATSERLNDVLLSVVGEKDYRSNSMIDETGKINFLGLAPGNYFLRAILQEYKFEPSSTTITIREGQHEYVELKGKKVSFSAFGRVREMSGLPVVGVIVEALSEQCDQHHSEAATMQDGSYRIRALKPNCQYRVSVKGTVDNEPTPHCFPSQFNVQMTAEDLKGLDMVAAPYDFSTDLAVEIEFGAMTIPSSYRVIIQQDGETISHSIVHAPISVFYHNNLPRDGKEYSVRVEPDRHSQSFIPNTVLFTADSPVRVVRVPITVSRRSGDVEISIASLLALPFFGIIALGFFNQVRSKEFLRSLVSVIQPSSPSLDRKKRK